jgi:hypothetical protein
MPRQSEIEKHDLGGRVLDMRLAGKTHKQISTALRDQHDLDVSPRQISRYLQTLNDNDRETTIMALKLELTQENARGEFMRYIGELNRRYDIVKTSRLMEDRQEANAILRLMDGALDKYLKVTGLYAKGRQPEPEDCSARIKALEEGHHHEIAVFIEVLDYVLRDHPDIKIDLSKALISARK